MFPFDVVPHSTTIIQAQITMWNSYVVISWWKESKKFCSLTPSVVMQHQFFSQFPQLFACKRPKMYAARIVYDNVIWKFKFCWAVVGFWKKMIMTRSFTVRAEIKFFLQKQQVLLASKPDMIIIEYVKCDTAWLLHLMILIGCISESEAA